MFFIPGTASLAPFYISKRPEPNICYMIYLQWLQTVHVSNRSALLEALPKRKDLSVNIDHFVEYTANPKYAFAPATGLSWLQIQKYLHWKTDRLNECILQKTGHFKSVGNEQYDDNNFNLEAFIDGQYKHSDLARKHRAKYEDVHRDIVNSHGLVMGYRLPTSSELSHYSSQQSAIPWTRKSRRTDALSKHNFLFQFCKQKHATSYSGKRSPYDPHIYPMDSLVKAGKHQNPIFGRVITKEWLLNDVNHPLSDWLEAYKKSGYCTLNDAVLKDSNGLLLHKDSLGHLQNFRYMGVNENEQAIAIGLEPVRGVQTVDIWHELAMPYLVIPDSLKLARDSVTIPLYRERLVCLSNADHQGGLETFGYYESLAANDIGFRCVLPYTGHRVSKSMKVKWK